MRTRELNSPETTPSSRVGETAPPLCWGMQTQQLSETSEPSATLSQTIPQLGSGQTTISGKGF